jgi:hypothetical protein
MSDRLAALEQRLGPPDPRRREEALAEASRRVINATNYFAAGGAPSCPVEHALVDNQLDIAAAVEQVLAARRGKSAG